MALKSVALEQGYRFAGCSATTLRQGRGGQLVASSLTPLARVMVVWHCQIPLPSPLGLRPLGAVDAEGGEGRGLSDQGEGTQGPRGDTPDAPKGERPNPS